MIVPDVESSLRVIRLQSNRRLRIDFRFFFAYDFRVRITQRPEVLVGRTIRVKGPFGTVYVTLNENGEGSPFELFVNTGKCGSDLAADAEAIGRLCSLLLSLPSSIPELQRIQSIIENLKGIGGSKNIELEGCPIRSVPDALAFALSQYLHSVETTDEHR
jgi:ribonucleoside-diphosphate reductase alpha chain